MEWFGAFLFMSLAVGVAAGVGIAVGVAAGVLVTGVSRDTARKLREGFRDWMSGR